jgi:hypothetical protein
MSFDPKDLYITREDFQMISGIDADRIHASRPWRFPYAYTFFVVAVVSLVAAISVVAIISQNFSVLHVVFSSLLSFVTVISLRDVIARRSKFRRVYKSLKSLSLEIKKYNIIVQTFDMKTQLDSIRYNEDFSEDWYQLRDFLEVAHENLIAALKVERILRDNKTILDQNPRLVADYLIGLDSFDIEDKAGEWSYLFDDAMEVAIAVRNEMQTLSRYDLPKNLD